MKNKVLLGLAVVLTVFLVTFSAGCVVGGTDPIVGEWKPCDSHGFVHSSSSSVIFYENGTADQIENGVSVLSPRGIIGVWDKVDWFGNIYHIGVVANGNIVDGGGYVILLDEGKYMSSINVEDMNGVPVTDAYAAYLSGDLKPQVIKVS